MDFSRSHFSRNIGFSLKAFPHKEEKNHGDDRFSFIFLIRVIKFEFISFRFSSKASGGI